MTNATWSNNPENGDWDNGSNWDSGIEPTDLAYFGESSITSITFSQVGNYVSAIEFSGAASAYDFQFGSFPSDPSSSAWLGINGVGVTNASGYTQTFTVAAFSSSYSDAQLVFSGSASACIPSVSTVSYQVGPSTPSAAGGGVMGFYDQATAGSAQFTVTTGAGTPPEDNSTVGGEVSFNDSSTGSNASFTIYGSTSTTDGDTFGNVVFRDTATADNATFTNVGGTVSGGDGGNTQFYVNATAAYGTFLNQGGTTSGANGGDVAFDGNADAGSATFRNYAAPASGAYGGVVSFNNNSPDVSDGGSSAKNGQFYNYGATDGEEGGGGHTEFTAKYGSPTADSGTFYNYGSTVPKGSGHTIFSVTTNTSTTPPSTNSYYPSAGAASIRNYSAPNTSGSAGYTEFAVYYEDNTYTPQDNGTPTAYGATISNDGSSVAGAPGGYTVFSAYATAGNATLYANMGSNGGQGGQIIFSNDSTGGSASITLTGNGVLSLAGSSQISIVPHNGALSIGNLTLTQGIIYTLIDTRSEYMTTLTVLSSLTINQDPVTIQIACNQGITLGYAYPILVSPDLTSSQVGLFSGTTVCGVTPVFSLSSGTLYMTYNDPAAAGARV